MLSHIIVVANLLALARGAPKAPPPPVEVPLTGGPNTDYNGYIVDISIQTQKYKLILDTGSADMVVLGEKCSIYKEGKTCVPEGPPVGDCNAGKPPRKNIGTSLQTKLANCYGDAVSKAFANYDVYKTDVAIQGVTGKDQYLGYIYEHTVGMFGEHVNPLPDGILGLGYNTLSSIYQKFGFPGITFMSNLANQHQFSGTFGMCFDPSGNGGKLIINGGRLPSMQYTDITYIFWYTVKVSSISINGHIIPHTSGLETIVDTGTTDLIVPGEVLDAIATVVCPALEKIKTPCQVTPQKTLVVPESIVATPQQIFTLPSITIKLPGASGSKEVTLVVSPLSYFKRDDSHPGGKFTYYYGVSNNGHGKTPPGRVAVTLGDVALLGYWIYFDTFNRQVGFSSVENCNQKYN